VTILAEKNQEIAVVLSSATSRVISSLLGRDVESSKKSILFSEDPLRLDTEWVLSVVYLIASEPFCVVRYHSEELVNMLKEMAGESQAPVDTALIAEVSNQISTIVGEALADELKIPHENLQTIVCDDAKIVPNPPFVSIAMDVDLKDQKTLQLAVDLPQEIAQKAGLLEENTTPPVENVSSSQSQEKNQETTTRPAAFTPMNPTNFAVGSSSFEIVHHVPMHIRAVLGRASLPLRDVVGMQVGTVFELEKVLNEPIDLYVNNVLIASGDVVVVEDKYAVKIRIVHTSSTSHS